MSKLQGDMYRDYWRARIAKGPQEVGFHYMDTEASEKQADKIFEFIQPFLPEVAPAIVVELGCGWGRMLRRFGKYWPETMFYGIDLCPEAIDHCKETLDPVQFCCEIGEYAPPKTKGIAEFVYTITCLQHITDDEVFKRATLSLWDALPPAPNLKNALFFENVDPKTKMSPHLRGHGWKGYIEHLPDHYAEERQPSLVLGGEIHVAITANKALHPKKTGLDKSQQSR